MSPADVPRAAIAGALAGSVDRLLTWAPGVQEASGPNEVHAARTAIRRLRSDLRSFRPALRGGQVRSLRRELGWAGGVLARVRELDVLLEQVEEATDGVPEGITEAFGGVVDRLRTERRVAWAVALGHLAEARSRQLKEELVALKEATPFRARPQLAIADLMGPGWRRLHRAVAAASADPSDESLHQVRIAAKRVRYAAEALEPVVGPKATSFARRAEELQDALGAHRDASSAVALLAGPAASMDPRGAYAAGILAARCSAARERAAEAAPRALRRLTNRKHRFW